MSQEQKGPGISPFEAMIRSKATFAAEVIEGALRAGCGAAARVAKNQDDRNVVATNFIECAVGSAAVFAANLSGPGEEVEARMIEMLKAKFELMRSNQTRAKIMSPVPNTTQ